MSKAQHADAQTADAADNAAAAQREASTAGGAGDAGAAAVGGAAPAGQAAQGLALQDPPEPTEGGRYVRNKDGSLAGHPETAKAAAKPEAQEPTDHFGDPQGLKAKAALAAQQAQA